MSWSVAGKFVDLLCKHFYFMRPADVSAALQGMALMVDAPAAISPESRKQLTAAVIANIRDTAQHLNASNLSQTFVS